VAKTELNVEVEQVEQVDCSKTQNGKFGEMRKKTL
jgi:hypothetical protein